MRHYSNEQYIITQNNIPLAAWAITTIGRKMGIHDGAVEWTWTRNTRGILAALAIYCTSAWNNLPIEVSAKLSNDGCVALLLRYLSAIDNNA
mmetsp:Transcript_11647/g.16770  ORF Transcript_11647/g.16770 Transcript_11647/m.16770 type:complete len:92 (-) Transcript_11647:321-596(-)